MLREHKKSTYDEIVNSITGNIESYLNDRQEMSVEEVNTHSKIENKIESMIRHPAKRYENLYYEICHAPKNESNQ